MEVKNVCSKCGEVNIIDSANLIREDVYDEFGTYYKLIYYKCRRCNEKIALQIDSMKTLEMFRELKALTIKVAKKRMMHETISPKDVKKKDKLMKKLRQERKDLEELCNGKKVFDSDKKVVMERLTFLKEGDIIDNNL